MKSYQLKNYYLKKINPLVMKNVMVTFFDHLEKEVLKSLCAEVKETLATGLVLPETKLKTSSFGSADLWSMRKKMKTARGRLNNRQGAFFIRG